MIPFFTKKVTQDADPHITDTAGHAQNVFNPVSLFQPANAGVPPMLNAHFMPAHSYIALQPIAMCVPLAPRISEQKMRSLTVCGREFFREMLRTQVQHS